MQRRPPELPNEFLTPCPPWCGGIHAREEAWGLSQFHSTAPVRLQVELAGEEWFLGDADINQYPAATDPLKRQAYAALHLEGPEAEMGPEDVEALAAAFEAYAGQLRGLAAKLARIRADDRAAKAWRT